MKKKLLSAAFSVVIGGIGIAAPASANAPAGKWDLCVGGLETKANTKVRSQPSTKSKQVGKTLPAGTYVDGISKNGWTHIKYPRNGYIRDDLLLCISGE